jgi:hypothetical protein
MPLPAGPSTSVKDARSSVLLFYSLSILLNQPFEMRSDSLKVSRSKWVRRFFKMKFQLLVCYNVFNEDQIFFQIAGEDRSPSVCGLCYDRCRDASCPPCGHLFCWNCINRWMHIRSQCPMCRQHLNSPADIIPLVNYK